MTSKAKKTTERPLMPKVDYTDFINILAREHARRQTASAEPGWLENNPDFEECKFRESLHFLTEDFVTWQALGIHYADVMEDARTTEELYNAIAEEVDKLANQAKLFITSPELLRLLYPLLRYRAATKEVK